MRSLAAARSASLALLFLGIYGGCNWLTSRRPGIGVWFFDWERGIPFWPLMIVPYLSIDVFFLAAPFLCRDPEELRVFTRRITGAIVVAGVCFLSFPLRFAFERPAVEGWVGVLFDSFTSLDRPFNQFPSLHITLAVVLAEIYARHTRGLTRAVLLVWFLLIGLSTVMTFQHHVIDLAGGLLLAGGVFYAIREPGTTQYSWERNFRAGLYYAGGCGGAAALAVLLWPWGTVLLWPAIGLGLVSAAYLGIGPWVFAKSGGRMPAVARLLLWPYLLGQRLSLAYYRRRCRPYDVVAPGVWIGRRLDEDEASRAVTDGVTAVLDLTADFDAPAAFRGVAYRNLQTLDLTAPSPELMDEAVTFVAEHARQGVVYVHCKIGYSRSAAVVAAWLLATGRASTTDEALRIVRGARPEAIVRTEAVTAVRRFEAFLGRVATKRTRPARPAGAVVSPLLAGAARLLCGTPRGLDASPARQRIYFANHTSHLDFVAVWGSLPHEVRVTTRPVAGHDYWDRGPIRRTIARLLGAVLVERSADDAPRDARIAAARRSVERAVEALDRGASLIIFPEGTRGGGGRVAPFKSGLYHLCRARPDVELVPVFLENLERILPKGETIPVPVGGSVTFGRPIRLRPGEDQASFLARARSALMMASGPCTSLSTAISRAS